MRRKRRAPKPTYSVLVNGSPISLGVSNAVADIEPAMYGRYLACQALNAAHAKAVVEIVEMDDTPRITRVLSTDKIGN